MSLLRHHHHHQPPDAVSSPSRNPSPDDDEDDDCDHSHSHNHGPCPPALLRPGGVREGEQQAIQRRPMSTIGGMSTTSEFSNTKTNISQGPSTTTSSSTSSCTIIITSAPSSSTGLTRPPKVVVSEEGDGTGKTAKGGGGDEDKDKDKGEEEEEKEEEEEVAECRICRESSGLLISPCRCRSPVHSACLRRWVGYRSDALFPLLSSSVRTSCEICRTPFDISKVYSSSSSSSSPTTTTTISGLSMLLSFFNVCGFNEDFASCATFFTVETCLFVFLFVLAIMGHALFVMGVFKDVETDEHQHKRVALAIANAIVTFALLLCVQKIVVRWLREANNYSIPNNHHSFIQDEHFSTATTTTGGGGGHHVHVVHVTAASRCTTISQIFLGALLSVVAAAEIFLIIRELPLGGLA